MKVQLISDTHGYHKQLKIQPDIDLIIHSGDATNYKDPFKNEIEFEDFIKWYANLDIKYKIFIPGNHDAFY